MERLESLVRDSLVDHEPDAPDPVGLLAVVRGGVTRQRRTRIGVGGAALAVAVAVTAVVAATPSKPPAPKIAVGGPSAPPVTPPVTAPPTGAPEAVLAEANALSQHFAPHPAATSVWVTTTLNAWLALEDMPVGPTDIPVYVVELRGVTVMDCRACKGPAPVTGRFGISVIPVTGNQGGELVVTNVDYPLSRLGKVAVLSGDY